MWVSGQIQPCTLGCDKDDRIRLVLNGVSKSRVSKVVVKLHSNRSFGTGVLWQQKFDEKDDELIESEKFILDIPYSDILPHAPDSTLHIWVMYRPKQEMPPIVYLPVVLEKLAYSFLDAEENLVVQEVHAH